MTVLLRIAERVLNRPLLVHPDKVPLILAVLQGRIPLGNVDELVVDAEARIAELPEAARASLTAPAPEGSRFVGEALDVDPQTGQVRGLPYRRTADGVALIPILGGLVNRGMALQGGSLSRQSYEGIKFQLQAAANDPRTRAVLLDIESPGGEAVGAMETAAAVRELAAKKPVTAVVNGMAASAAYAIASGARQIVTAPSGVAGSIGVVMVHADFSRALDKEGITPTLIFAGAHKVDGNPFEPLPDGVRDDLQREVNQFYDLFVQAVAAGRRGLSPAAIRATEARIFIGEEAVKAGLADRVGTFEEALADLSAARGGQLSSPPRRSSMSEQTGKPAAETDAGKAEAGAPGADVTAPPPAPPAPATEPAAAEDPRQRVKAILALEEAKGREALAQTIALDTDNSVEQAKALLAAAATASATPSIAERQAGQAAALAGRPDPNGGKPDVAASWDEAVAKVNAQYGVGAAKR